MENKDDDLERRNEMITELQRELKQKNELLRCITTGIEEIEEIGREREEELVNKVKERENELKIAVESWKNIGEELEETKEQRNKFRELLKKEGNAKKMLKEQIEDNIRKKKEAIDQFEIFKKEVTGVKE